MLIDRADTLTSTFLQFAGKFHETYAEDME